MKPNRLAIVFVTVALTVAACAGPAAVPTASAPSVAPVATGSAGPTATALATGAPATVRLALDWTPNTNHSGFFVARHEGWYRDAGIDLKVLPYSGTTPEALMAAHQAE
ncbi:MAG TPA: ABC transporter substrate-binding protein, partial [Candidatus Limnocylindrales bacterium]